MPLSEIILSITVLLQGSCLLLGKRKAATAVMVALGSLGLLGAAADLLILLDAPAYAIWSNLLEDQPLFRLPRAALFVAALLLSRTVATTRELPTGRKSEALFLLSSLVWAADLLLLSQHAILTCILLALISWLAACLGGLAFRGRLEGEAVLKQWLQASLALVVGFGALTLISLLAGGAHYGELATFVKSQEAYSPEVLAAVISLCLPFFMAGGLFPFHFVFVDRDEGMPWSVQTMLSVIAQGAISLAAWKMGMEIFGHSRPNQVSEGLRTLQLCGLIGGFWLALFSLSQQNAKRLFSSMNSVQWSVILAAGALPSVLGVTAVAYAFSTAFLWSSLLGFIWSRFQEQAAGNQLSDVYGAGRLFRTGGLILLLALASPLCIPGFPGLPTVLYLLAAVIEQQSLFLLAAQAVLLSFLCLLSIRIVADLLFRRGASTRIPAAANGPDQFRYGALDWGFLAILVSSLLALGILWHRAFALLSQAAKTFLN
jgi:NADH:ubiquinone oxidoreductase subunit 2 (subunit N)